MIRSSEKFKGFGFAWEGRVGFPYLFRDFCFSISCIDYFDNVLSDVSYLSFCLSSIINIYRSYD